MYFKHFEIRLYTRSKLLAVRSLAYSIFTSPQVVVIAIIVIVIVIIVVALIIIITIIIITIIIIKEVRVT